jgi:hypothetical protein
LSGGTLKASRTNNTALTALGLIWVGGSTTANNSVIDWGTINDPVSAVTSTISMSGTGTGWSGIYVAGNTSSTTVSNTACFCGLEKTRNTFLTLSASAGQNKIKVDTCTNWLTGDVIVIESDTINTSRCLSGAKIQSVNFSTKEITLDTNVNFDRLSGTRVGNFTSTVTYKTLESSPLAFGIYMGGLTNSIYQFSNITVENIGSAVRTSTNASDVGGNAGITYVANFNLTQPIIKSVAFYTTTPLNPPTANTAINITVVPYNEVLIDDCAIFTNATGSFKGLFFGTNVASTINNTVIYRSYGCYNNNGYNINFKNCYLNSENSLNAGNNTGTYTNFNKCKIKSNYPLINFDNQIYQNLNSCDITSLTNRAFVTNTANSFGNATLDNCTINMPVSTYISDTPTIRSLLDSNINVYNPNNDSTYTTFNYFHHATTNFSIRKNGITSLSFRPKIANTAFVKSFTIPAIQGVTQKIKGNLRFDSNYGTATPPSISFAGAVATTTFTSPAVANAWNSFEYDLTPTYTGDVQVTITGTSTLTSGFVYLDGLRLDPFIKDTRWYGYQVDKNSYRTIDTLTTLTENQVSSVDITNLDRLYDASNYWTINNPLSTSYLDLYTRNGTILDFGDKNIIVNNSASTNFAYASASKTITIKTPSLSAGNNFSTLKTTGNITLTSGDISFITINGNVTQNTPVSLSSVNITGTLTYNTNTPNPTKIIYTNCNVLSATNLGSANVIIKKLNSTVTYV